MFEEHSRVSEGERGGGESREGMGHVVRALEAMTILNFTQTL